MSNIDTLFFEPVGTNGGSYFESMSFERAGEISFAGKFHFRKDSIRLSLSGSGSQRIGNQSDENELSYKKAEIDSAKRVKVGFRRDGDGDLKIENGKEPCFGGVYRISFEKTAGSEGIELKDREKFNYLEYAQFPVPEGFKIAGFHGNFGARIDKFGIILEKNLK